MMSSINEQLPPPKARISPLEFRNTDLVSRLLAATPPYLYNMSLIPNTYFFSEMLRSFVQAKSDSRPFQPRRTRKRPWTSLKPDNAPKIDHINSEWSLKSSFTETKPNESPLELTTDSEKLKSHTSSERKFEMPLPDSMEPMYSAVGQENPSGLILPPPPPMWYPPLYPTSPPYGIDPLHFFIDLRVSGHIYDRKNQKEETCKPEHEEKLMSRQTSFKQSRHASAFSVPTPRLKNAPINLSNIEDQQDYSQDSKIKFHVKSMGFDKTCNKTGTSYVLSNISKVYKNIAESAQSNVEGESGNETEEEKQKKVKDLRALIGLELVVDYMNHAKPLPRRPADESESLGSPTLEVVALHDET